MWSTCLFCHQALGTNEVVEMFPVGRRLAFDQKRGRLWVVCRKCEKWNLTPLDERWEAIEQCERTFRDARKRVTSENIGLARVGDGLELVRIGEPLRPEFAAWRYGDQFGRRRRRALLLGGGAAAVGVGLVAATMVTGVLSALYVAWQGADVAYGAVRHKRVVAVVPAGGRRLTVRGKHLERMCVHVPQDDPDGWGVHLPHDGGVELFLGDEARRVAALVMPRLNSGGASRRRVAAAVAELEAAGDAATYLREVAHGMGPRFGRRQDHGLLHNVALETRLAIEMAVNEENERAALEGELELLEEDWRAAEEIAAIADTLGLPDDLGAQIDALRAR